MSGCFGSFLLVPSIRRSLVGSALLWAYLAVLMPSGLGDALHRTEHLWRNLTTVAEHHHGAQSTHHHHHHHTHDGHEHTHSQLVIGLLEQSPGAHTEAVTAQQVDQGNGERLHLVPSWAGLWFAGNPGHRNDGVAAGVTVSDHRPPTPPPRGFNT